MKVVTFLSIFMLFFSSSANAKNTFWMRDPPNKKVRQEQAAEWLNCFRKVEDQIPTLSPAEKRWLEVEVDNELAKGTYTRRAMEAMESKEYNIRVARSHLEELNLTLTLISDNKSVDKNFVMMNWALLANQFIDFNFWQSITYLVDHKIIDKEICGLKDFYLSNFTLQTQAIIRRVIINHLNGTLP